MRNLGASSVLVVAPHPDDETLGCGGTLQRHKEEGAILHWLIVTNMSPEAGYSAQEINVREEEIANVVRHIGFSSVIRLGYPAATLNEISPRLLIQNMAEAFDRLRPECLYLPNAHDAHSDHRVCFDTAVACAKWFRRPHLSRILCYEVPSETGFYLHPSAPAFKPTTYVSLSEDHLAKKISAMLEYKGECGKFPFPRSVEAVTALARHRGSECGAGLAEGFILLRETL